MPLAFPESPTVDEVFSSPPEINDSEEVLTWTRERVRALTSHQRRHLDIGEVPTVKLQEVPGQEFLERDDLSVLREEVFASIDRNFAPYIDPRTETEVHREEKFRRELHKPDLKVCMATCGGHLIQVHTVEDIPGDMKDIDWLALNPRNPVWGISGEACFSKAVRPIIEEHDCVADIRPYEQSGLIMMEPFGFISYGMTDEADRQYATYMRIRSLQEERGQYISRQLTEENLRGMIRLCDEEGFDTAVNIDYSLSFEQSNPFKVMKVAFPGLTHQQDLEDCPLYSFLRTVSQDKNSWVMTRLIPSPNKGEIKTFYCIFEQTILSSKTFAEFQENMITWRRQKAAY